MEPVSKQHWTAALLAAGMIMAFPAESRSEAQPQPSGASADSLSAKAAADSASPAAEAQQAEAAAPAMEAPAAPAASMREPESAPVPMTRRIAEWEKNELGVSITGKASSRFLQSAISGDSARIAQPTHENVAYSRADIMFQARPSASTVGNLEFRIHQDWNNYYNEGPDPLLTRWYNFGGTVGDGKVKFDIGDFRERFSPLTIYSPGVDLLYEPEIFAARRQSAMDEWHLGDHKLPLTGLRAAYAQDLGANGGLDAGFTGARLRTGGAVNLSDLFWTDDVDKYAATGYLKFNLFKALQAGATHIEVFDPVKTSRSLNNEYIALTPTAVYEDVQPVAGRQALPRREPDLGAPGCGIGHVRLPEELRREGHHRFPHRDPPEAGRLSGFRRPPHPGSAGEQGS
jgi:hypothetical protein